VWQVRASFDQKPYRRSMMETWGATVHPPPPTSPRPAAPSSPGSRQSRQLGIAISEAVEVAAQNPDTKYALGSVLNHVLMHQTIIGEEALVQLNKAGESPT
jgi:tryptophan synthase beta chain